MNSELFVERINSELCKGTVSSLLELLDNPPGREPSPDLLKLSQWFKTLDSTDRKMTINLLELTARSSIFGFLCVLDGVRQIEDSTEKGNLELWYKSNDMTKQLNSPDGDMLHDLLP